MRAIRFVTFPYYSPHPNLWRIHVRLGMIQTGFHTQISLLSLPLSPEQNRINNLHFNSSVTQVIVRMCAQSKTLKNTTCICVKRPGFSALSQLFVFFPNIFIFKSLQAACICAVPLVRLYKANIDQLLWHTKNFLCRLCCTKSSLQAHIEHNHKCTHQDPECIGGLCNMRTRQE